MTITNIANPYYAEMQGGIEEVAAKANRRIIVGNSNEDPNLERQLVADFIGRRVEGLIIVPAHPLKRITSSRRTWRTPWCLRLVEFQVWASTPC